MKKYLVYEYRDSFGIGSTKIFTDKEKAVSFAKKHGRLCVIRIMCHKDKESYLKDSAGQFRVFEADLSQNQWELYDEGELSDIESYETEDVVASSYLRCPS